MFDSVETAAGAFKLGMFLCGFVVMFGVESVRPVRGWEAGRRSRVLFHGGLAVFNAVLLRFVAVGPLLMWVGYVNSRGWGICGLFGLRGVWGVAVSLVVLDMFNYWWHRWNHRVAFLWRFHKVHHVDTHLDVTTSLRFHPGELVISSGLKAIWILLVGPSLWAFVIFEACITLAAQFHHMNVDFSDGVEKAVRSVTVTPRYHAGHHTVCRRTGDNNFSTILIVWDKLFGTYREPDYGEMRYLGLPRGRSRYLSWDATLKGPFSDEY